MKDVGLTRAEAEDILSREWKKFQTAFRRKKKIEDEHISFHHREDWLQAEHEGLTALRKRSPIEESGIVPWKESDSLASIDPTDEYWALRVMAPTYDEHYTERSLIKAITIRTPHYRLALDKAQAEELLNQLTYELDRWDQK